MINLPTEPKPPKGAVCYSLQLVEGAELEFRPGTWKAKLVTSRPSFGFLFEGTFHLWDFAGHQVFQFEARPRMVGRQWLIAASA
jgi:hypothetical protein